MVLPHVKLHDGSIFAAIVYEKTWIHLLKDWDTEFVIQAEEEVLGVELTCCDQPLPSVWVHTDRAVWLVSPSHLTAMGQPSLGREDQDMSGDIFDDLMTESCELFDVARPALPEVLVLSSGRLVWKESGIEHLAPAPSCLVIAVREQSGSFSIKILQVPEAAEEPSSVASTWTLPDCFLGKDSHRLTDENGLKLKIIKCASSNPGHGVSSQILALDPGLFVRLFGVDASLLDTLMVLACNEEGHVYYRPMRSLEVIANREQTPWKLLCDAGGPVQNILSVSLPRNSSSDAGGAGDFQLPEPSDDSVSGSSRNNTLCIVTSLGKVTLISANPDSRTAVPGSAFGDLRSPPQICMRSGTLCSSVLTSSSEGSALYHSSGRGVMRSEMSSDKEGWGGDVVSEVALTHLVTFRNASGEVRLACLLPSGQLLQAKAKTSLPELGNPAARIKASLLGLHSKGRQLEKIDGQAQDRTTYLRQLQTAAHLLVTPSKGQKLSHCVGRGIDCKVEVESREDGCGVDYSVCCCLENRLGLELSGAWSLAVTVCGGGQAESTSLTHSSRLGNGLADGSSFLLRCQLTESLLGDCTVHVTLILHAPDWLSSIPESHRGGQPNSQESGIPVALAVPVATKALDAVSFLHHRQLAREAGGGEAVLGSSLPQLHSLSLPVPPAALPADLQQQSDDCTSLLSWLLRGSQLRELEHGRCEARDWKGRSISLLALRDGKVSSERSESRGEGPGGQVGGEASADTVGPTRYQLVLRSEHLSLLATTRQALLGRLQEVVLGKEGVSLPPCTGLQLKRFLSSLQNVLEESHRAVQGRTPVQDSQLRKLYEDLRLLECPL